VKDSAAFCDPAIEPASQTAWPQLPAGVPPLQTLYLYLTAGCNLRCRHCWITPSFVHGAPSPGDCIDVRALQEAIVDARPWGLSSAKLTGGEPLLHPDFLGIVRMLTEQQLTLSMETNGTLIDRELAFELRRNTTLKHIAVSLDSAVEAQHDRFRGLKGAFATAVRGIEHLVAAGYRPQVIMSVCRDNIEQVEPLVALAAGLGAGSVKFNPVTPSGRGIDLHKMGQGLSSDEILGLSHRIRGPLQDRYPIPLFIMAPPALATVRELLRGGCGGGSCNVRGVLGILGSGEFALCGIGRNVQELCFGVLGRDRIRDVWADHPVLVRLREDLSGPYPGVCGDCIHAARCQTVCVALNYQVNGALVSVPPICAEIERRGLFPPSRRVSAAGKASA